jgi:hypothetical protein
LLSCNIGGLQDLRLTPPATVCSRLAVSLAFRLINPAANPAMWFVVVVAVVGLVVVIISNVRDDILARFKEVVVLATRPPDPVGRMNFVGIKCGHKFFMEG